MESKKKQIRKLKGESLISSMIFKNSKNGQKKQNTSTIFEIRKKRQNKNFIPFIALSRSCFLILLSSIL